MAISATENLRVIDIEGEPVAGETPPPKVSEEKETVTPKVSAEVESLKTKIKTVTEKAAKGLSPTTEDYLSLTELLAAMGKAVIELNVKLDVDKQHRIEARDNLKRMLAASETVADACKDMVGLHRLALEQNKSISDRQATQDIRNDSRISLDAYNSTVDKLVKIIGYVAIVLLAVIILLVVYVIKIPVSAVIPGIGPVSVGAPVITIPMEPK